MKPSDGKNSSDLRISEEQAEAIRVLSTQKWADQLLGAETARAQEAMRLLVLNGGGVLDAKFTETQQIAFDIVSWLATVFRSGEAQHPDDQAALRRMRDAFRPHDRDQRIAMACNLIEEHAVRYQDLPEGPASLDAWTVREEVANALAVSLWGIDEGFGPLVPMVSSLGHGELLPEVTQRDKRLLARVSELLDVFKRDSGRRTSEGKHSGKLSAAGVLRELNILAGHPLGKPLSTQAINQALSRWRGKNGSQTP